MTASSISQFGITWTFDADREVGKYANGDYYVVAPAGLRIVSITPASTRDASGRVKNGSMVNLPTGFTSYSQGFDSAMYAQYGPFYDPALNVGRPNDADISSANPLVLAPGTSLVSSVSKPAASSQADRVQLEDTAILTVVASAPAANSFRPPMFGADKTHSWNKAQLDYSVFRSLAPVDGTPSLDAVAAVFAHPWWTAYFHTSSLLQNTSTMRNPSGSSGLYGREVAHAVSDAVLSLNLNYTNAEKELLLVRLVQFGIDIYGAVAFAGGEWRDNAGILLGCKMPMVVAGLALKDPKILEWADATKHRVFSEDLQTWVVSAEDVGRAVTKGGNGWDDRETYSAEHVGLPEWGEQHTRYPLYDDSRLNGVGYRAIFGFAEVGGALGVRLMAGGMAAWNWAPYFDYIDRYQAQQPEGGKLSMFHQAMWDAYRSLAGNPQPTPEPEPAPTPTPLPIPAPIPDPAPEPGEAPLITLAPESQTVRKQYPVTFKVAAIGTAPLAISWYHNGTLTATTGDTYHIPKVNPGMRGNVTAVVTNDYGKASASAQLSVR